MQIPIYQVDAFSTSVFGGNPAAVCPLDQWLPDAQLQAIAAENNLSETAFFVRNGSRFDLRWMTPTVEIDLCGHATLASAFVILNYLDPSRDAVQFDTRSGELTVERNGDRLSMDFPSRPPQPCNAGPEVAASLGGAPKEILASRDYLVVYDTEAEVRALVPDMTAVAALDRFAVIVTAPGSDCDFVSRFFAPAGGVAEDPVTGSAHCTLIPYWSQRLGKTELNARQVSKRGGELRCSYRGDRVTIAGRAVLYLQGRIHI